MTRDLVNAMSRATLLLDSGMGTRLLARAEVRSPECLALVNLAEPRIVWRNHKDDVEAGADGVVANTFRADRPSLERAGRAGDFVAINRDGVRLAREAAGPNRFVIGSIAPIPGRDAATSYREQAEVLAQAGCDALMLETHDLEGATAGLIALRELAQILPLCACLWTWPGDAGGAARRLEDLGAAAVGTNCGDGLDDVVEATIRLVGSVRIPLIAKPSAGSPAGPAASHESFAHAVPALVMAGARLLGGCCGTNPEHVRAMRGALGPRRLASDLD